MVPGPEGERLVRKLMIRMTVNVEDEGLLEDQHAYVALARRNPALLVAWFDGNSNLLSLPGSLERGRSVECF